MLPTAAVEQEDRVTVEVYLLRVYRRGLGGEILPGLQQNPLEAVVEDCAGAAPAGDDAARRQRNMMSPQASASKASEGELGVPEPVYSDSEGTTAMNPKGSDMPNNGVASGTDVQKMHVFGAKDTIEHRTDDMDDIDPADLEATQLQPLGEQLTTSTSGKRLKPLKVPLRTRPHLAWQDQWHPYRSPGRLAKKSDEPRLSPIHPERDPQVLWKKEQARLTERHQQNLRSTKQVDHTVAHYRSRLQERQHNLLNEDERQRKLELDKQWKEREAQRQRKRGAQNKVRGGLPPPGGDLLDEWLEWKEESHNKLTPQSKSNGTLKQVEHRPHGEGSFGNMMARPAGHDVQEHQKGNMDKQALDAPPGPAAITDASPQNQQTWWMQEESVSVPHRLLEPSWRSIMRPVEKSLARRAWESRRDPRGLKFKEKQKQKQKMYEPQLTGVSPSAPSATVGGHRLPQVTAPPRLPRNILHSMPLPL